MKTKALLILSMLLLTNANASFRYTFNCYQENVDKSSYQLILAQEQTHYINDRGVYALDSNQQNKEVIAMFWETGSLETQVLGENEYEFSFVNKDNTRALFVDITTERRYQCNLTSSSEN